ncbi:hypothetical protein [Pseudomonas nitroreducens]|uniref:hypothetical protein n=1 Tax=Pseudomonas nitroreducens TaxID=46680 RepID=UPI003D29DCB2
MSRIQRPIRKPKLGKPMNRMLKNLLSGIGSVLVLYPASGYSHYRNSDFEYGRSEIEALRADVRAIGGDFNKAVRKGSRRVEAAKANQV